MAIAADDWTEIERALSGDSADAGVVAELRRRFPRLSFTRCDAADLTEAPYRSFARFDVHLIDSADHCVRITTEPGSATGLVVADRALGR